MNDMELAMLNIAVENGRKLGRPFTEEEVFRPIWDVGYELMPEMDVRFVCVKEATAKRPALYTIDEDEKSLFSKRMHNFLCELCWFANRCRDTAYFQAKDYNRNASEYRKFSELYAEYLANFGFVEARRIR